MRRPSRRMSWTEQAALGWLRLYSQVTETPILTRMLIKRGMGNARITEGQSAYIARNVSKVQRWLNRMATSKNP